MIEYLNLIKIQKGPSETKSMIVIHVDGNSFKYLNDMEKLNDSLENIELEYWYYDELGRTIFENREISFVTKEAAKKFIDAFYADGNTENGHIGYKTSSQYKQQENSRNSYIESAFDEKYIENFLL